jgi:sporulation protein YlmC with PRC-barrel domain
MNVPNTGAGGPIVVPKVVDVEIVAKSSVTNDHGENLGKVETLMLDLETGKVAYAVLGFGGFPNRTKLLAVPWELFTFSHHDKRLILNVPRDVLLNTAGYDTMEQVVQTPDFYWLGDIYEYYSHKTEWDQRRAEERSADVVRAQQKRAEIANIRRQEPMPTGPN